MQNNGFYGLSIAPALLEKVERLGFSVPTPIQRKAIPVAIEGKDIMGIAQTGTGKTLAFGIPMVQRLAQRKGRGLVLVPTRELALQVRDALIPFAQALGMGVTALIGGESMMPQLSSLRKNPRIIIATPGRLIDHIERRNVRLDDTHILVLDEADRMFDMGFAPQIERILKVIPKDRQTMLFSATMPAEIVKVASVHMRLPVRTEIAPPGTAAEKVSQEIFVVKKEMKGALLGELLKQYTGTVLLFTRTKRGAHKVTQLLKTTGNAAAEIHSDRSLGQRKEALNGFKSGKYRILVATDIAARGIDVTGIELVINYDLPDDPGNYVHRIGRTGRAGQKGHAIALATPDQGRDVRNIEKLIKTSIALSAHPKFPAGRFSAAPAAQARVQRPSRAGGGWRAPHSKSHKSR
ncbi:MAG: DEAD/DEAH box helicase [Deltaproteobacteria bacterium]|nr:DEAD/DEAH box helicase [Deltaproteobacteria bacterium]